MTLLTSTTAAASADTERADVGSAGPTEPLETSLRFVVAALALAAAAIHFAVTREHWQEWRLAGAFFALLGVVQLGWALSVLHGRVLGGGSRALLALGASVQLEVVVVWLVSRTSGLPFGPQAHVPEAAGLADVLCSVMEVLSAVGAGLLLHPRTARRLVPRAVGLATAGILGTAVAVATTLSLLPAAGGGHEHLRVGGDVPTGWTTGCHHHLGGGHAAGSCTNAKVTPAQRAAAEQLVTDTMAVVPRKYPTLQAAQADGYQLLNVDGPVVHVQRPDYQADGRVLDPNRVESLVYVTYRGQSMLMGAMYIAEPAAPAGPLIGGALTSWHIHTNLCVNSQARTMLNAGPHHSCGPGASVRPTPQMLHVWTRPYPGGPFADLTQAGAQDALQELKRRTAAG